MTPRSSSLCFSSFEDGLRPDPDLSVSQWADENRVLDTRGSAEPGPWRTARTPFLREIMDSLGAHDPCEVVVFQKGTQIGATEAGNNWIGYSIAHHPGPILYVQPTAELAKRYSKQRVSPMIEASPALRKLVQPARSRDSGNTILTKEFPGGFLAMVGANSSRGLASMPARDVFFDEVDRYPFDVDGEGDPIELGRRRTDTFGHSRKIFLCSTPTVKGLSRIEAAYEKSDQRRYHVPCPHCGAFAPIEWKNIQWPDGEPEKAALECESCKELIEERFKSAMLTNGEWVAQAEGDGKTKGYHLSSLYSPLGWRSWGEIAVDFLKAKHEGAESLKAWVNTSLGETWEESGHSVDPDPLHARREEYEAPVPAGAVVLTAGVDVQEDRLEIEVVAWGPGEESWSIEYLHVWGDTQKKELWEDLEEVLERRWTHAGGVDMRISCACIDSGYATKYVYEFCKGRQVRMFFPTKGRDGSGMPISKLSTMRVGRQRNPMQLYILGVDEIKSLLYSRLGRSDPGPGFCHFPQADEYEEEYFAQLTAETRVLRVVRGVSSYHWVKKRPRNEALDCRVYAMGALSILNPRWHRVSLALEERIEKNAGTPEDEPDTPRAPSRRIRPKPKGWASRWK